MHLNVTAVFIMTITTIVVADIFGISASVSCRYINILQLDYGRVRVDVSLKNRKLHIEWIM